MYSRLQELLRTKFPRFGSKSGHGGSNYARDAESIFRFLVDNSPEMIFCTALDGAILHVNDIACQFLGYSRTELSSVELQDIAPNIDQLINEAKSQRDPLVQPIHIQSQLVNKSGISTTLDFFIHEITVGVQTYHCTYAREIVLEKDLRKQLLESIAKGIPLDQILHLIVDLAEKTRSGSVASIMLLGPDGTLSNAANRHLSASFCEQLEGCEPGPRSGSCGASVHACSLVLTENIANSSVWLELLSAAQTEGVQACWAIPIVSSQNEMLGAFALYFDSPQSPSERDTELLKTFSQLARVAIERSRQDEALRQSARQMRTITDALPVMIVYVEPSFRIQFVNATRRARFNKPQGEIIGKHLREMIGEKRFGEVRHHFEMAFAGHSSHYEKKTNESIDGSSRISEVRLVPDVDSEGRVIGVYALMDDITSIRNLENDVLNIASEEQRRIGQDLHDGTGQELTGLGMMADALAVSLSRTASSEQAIAKKLAQGIRRCLGQVRSIAKGLSPVDVSAESLNETLAEMAEHVEQLYQIQCHVNVEIAPHIVDHQIATQLFRIAQEATTNAVKHGQAKTVTIGLQASPTEITLSIQDDGRGIDLTGNPTDGMGIKTMNYRADVMGGSLAIGRKEDGGTQVQCRVPLDEKVKPDALPQVPIRERVPPPHKNSGSIPNVRGTETD